MPRTPSASRSDPPRAGSARGEILSFMRLIWAVGHGLQRTSKHMNRTLGLTGPQRLVIRLLGRTPGMSAGQLADELHLDPSTLTGILQRLESRRLVARQKDPADGRRLQLSLTDKGRQINAPTPGTVESAVTKALSRRSPREVKAVRLALADIADALSAAADELQTRPRRRQRRAR